ncbi:tRNA lysidine(34) synthetase TilS [Anaerobium acetethylicum]|nr:tRNA lysidine(34) synthetase TilS [Anaerobium acetethylicum]
MDGAVMVNKVLSYIREFGLLEAGDRVVTGVSGGADSVCLLFMLLEISRKIPIEIFVVHVEHGMRGDESLEDAKFVETLCSENGIGYRLFSVNINETSKKEKISLEEAGRIARYDAFSQIVSEWGGSRIAVAHNRNDNAETVLLNLFRGTGVKGLCGIPPKRGNIIRPLLCLTRAEIEAYLSERKISYRSDYTNFEDDYTRNKIRLNILPYVEETINSRALDHISEASKYLRQAEEFIEKNALAAYDRCVVEEPSGNVIMLEAFEQQETIIQEYIMRMSIEKVLNRLKNISGRNIEDVLGLKGRQVGRYVTLPDGLIARRGYNEIFIEKKPEGLPQARHGRQKAAGERVPEVQIEVLVPGTCRCESLGMDIEFSLITRAENQQIPEKTYTKWFDYDKIKFNLQLRTRKSGDYIQVNSVGARKKLKAYLIDEKIPAEERDRILLLADGSHILWVFGHRISEAYKVTEETKRILIVRINGGKENV